MLYVRYQGSDGLEILVPIRDSNVYLQCEHCGYLKPLDDPLEYIADLGNIGASFETSFNECEECAEERYAIEDRYCTRMKSEK